LLFGPSMIVVAGLGLYIFTVHNSKNFVCSDCVKKICPVCHEKLSNKNYCKKCNIVICPFCDSHQTHKRPLSWLSTIVGMLFFTVSIALVIFLLLIDLMWAVLFVVILLYFSSPTCGKCNKKIHTEYF
jgi:hypothetical protein